MSRTCGTCSMCCKLLYIDELKKPPNQWCSHVMKGGGCSIYDSRPAEVCGAFKCHWLFDESLGEEWKPQRSKFIVHAGTGGHVVWINVDVTQPLAWKKEPYYSRIKTWSGIARTGKGYVAVIIGKRFYVVFPEEDLEISGFEPGAADISVGYRNTDGWSRPLVKMYNREESVQEFLGLPFRRPYGG